MMLLLKKRSISVAYDHTYACVQICMQADTYTHLTLFALFARSQLPSMMMQGGSYEGQATHPTARSLAFYLLHFPVLDLRQGATAQRAQAGGTKRILGRFQERKLWPLLRGSRGLHGRGTCVGPRGPATTQKKKRRSSLRDGSLGGIGHGGCGLCGGCWGVFCLY